MNKNKKKGFTLVELLVVIAILAILATVSIIGYTSFTKKAEDSVYLQEKTQQQIADLAERVDNLDLLTWDDVENATKEALDNRGDTDVQTAINNLATQLKNRTGNTLLTKEQVTKIIDKALEDRDIPSIEDLEEIVEEMYVQPVSDPHLRLVADIESQSEAQTASYCVVTGDNKNYSWNHLPEDFGSDSKIVMLSDENGDNFIAWNHSKIDIDANGHSIVFGKDGIAAFGSGVILTLRDSKGDGLFVSDTICPTSGGVIIIESGVYDIGDFGPGFGGISVKDLDGTLKINGGKFSIDPGEYVSTGHSATKVGDWWVVE